MKINLEILSSAYLLGEKSIDTLRTKELVPQMMIRRRLTRASKIAVELLARVEHFQGGRVMFGSSFGELETTANILHAIKDAQPISPTDFQNSVYNTAVSYLSILNNNQNEILTLSSGDKTSLNVLKMGALKALDGDVILLMCVESLDISNIAEVNKCIDFLESGVALVVRVSDKKATMSLQKSELLGIPNSISQMLHVAQKAEELQNPIVEIEL
ncbi:MAG: beta-ketoacyl synthase chain length factor [Sulfurospirillaceae bacterium]|nr:beta-ketoacyl synthase chain length factor [Sulfurospirillaceae bacterium]MDD3462126.1 beta-ketoacyl synthase chain length factor [Sulfurospirillaceae bacterium]